MTHQQINERIAKLCGWKQSCGMWSPEEGVYAFDPPAYAYSLDCCREFESKLTATEQTEYAVQLRYIVTRNVERDHEPLNPDTLRIPDGRYYCATPLERCEAFLRMKGQRDES